MRIALSADERTGISDLIEPALRRRGHEVITFGALAESDRADWAWCSEAAAQAVADGDADMAVVCCWTGTGASIAANKVPGIRAALCVDAATAAGARQWNDANVLALSLRLTSMAVLTELLDAWFKTEPSSDPSDRASIDHVTRAPAADEESSADEAPGDDPEPDLPAPSRWRRR